MATKKAAPKKKIVTKDKVERVFTDEGRERIAEAQRKRWAKYRKEKAAEAKVAKKAAK